MIQYASGDAVSDRETVLLSKMNRTVFLIAVALWQSTSAASAERIKRAPPDDAELARLASEHAINDGDLRKGDIISILRGYLQFRGIKEDGSYDFAPVPNPFSTERRAPVRFR